MRINFLILALIALFMPVLAQAHDGVHVANAYALETASTDTAAVFLQISSPEATQDDALIGVSTSRAQKAELHTMTHDENGVMKMRPLDRLPVPKHVTVDLTPMGNHIMLMGLDAPLKTGETFTLTLIFEHEGNVDVDVPVKAMDAEQPDGHHGHH